MNQTIIAVAAAMCDKYCRYPYEWDEEKEGQTLDDAVCKDCPLNMLGEQAEKYISEPQKDLALKAMEGAKPKYRKGKYGKQYDSHTCGNCGYQISVTYDYCPKCGYRLLWDNPRCLTDTHPSCGAKMEESEEA